MVFLEEVAVQEQMPEGIDNWTSLFIMPLTTTTKWQLVECIIPLHLTEVGSVIIGKQ